MDRLLNSLHKIVSGDLKSFFKDISNISKSLDELVELKRRELDLLEIKNKDMLFENSLNKIMNNKACSCGNCNHVESDKE